ncbi:multidrug resistance-associated protein 1 isoform X2 [Halyomorpha halys]|uniref:multidrug resistance-associated protein 1 isoform X2 n=1 Tax=Halyomorpha halys TaxID=286706 RepID=UPI0006D4E163|nr:multidrug resistance-associated protein 1 isoform X2 [Halyomorpha halys]
MFEETLNSFCGSTFWDNNVTWFTESPRFTQCFEKTALVCTPCIFLWVFASVDIYFTLSSKTKDIPWNWRSKLKLVFISVLIIICLFDLLSNILKINEVFPADIFIPLFKIISLVLCCILVTLHRKFAQRSSGLMFLFWFLVVLFEFPRFFSSVKNLADVLVIGILNIAYYFFSVCLFVLQWFVDLPPTSSSHAPVKNPCPEECASFPSRLTFSWFNPLLSKGSKRTLTSDDLWSIEFQNTGLQVFTIFNKYWNNAIIKKNGSIFKNSAKFMKNDESVKIAAGEVGYKPCSIVQPLCKAFGPAFFVCSVFKIVQILLSFISPQLLKYLILFMEGNEPRWHGYLYASLLLFFSTLQMFFMTQFGKISQVIGLRIRSALTLAIYRKALKLSNSSKKESTVGEIVNLMAVDAQRFYQLINSLSNLWSFPVQILLATTLLWQSLGPSVLSGLAILVVMIPLNGYLVNRARGLQIKQMKYKDERIKIMNEVFSGMKVLKLYAWEPSFQDRILKIRKKEANLLKKTAYLKAFIAFIWTSAPFLVSLVTFATYVLIDENNILDTSKAFVSLALFNILRPPLVILPMVFNNVMQAGVSIKRLNKFLNSEELDPNEVTHNEKDDKDALKMENATFSWGFNEEPKLRHLNLLVQPGSLVAVVGTVGSGKSSLISAFLGEMHKVSGEVCIKGSIAYVPQQAWIQNCTLQDNILFGKNLDEKRYNKLIDACALRQDLGILPGGDQTEIGERGINLSGGQKQRVSLARALYADCDIYFLDDPLSAVDSHVGKSIFEEVISSRGILKGKTRLFVTNSINDLSETDMIVVLKDGEISEIGTYHELLDMKGAFSDFLTTYSNKIDNEDSQAIDCDLGDHIIKSNPALNQRKSPIKSDSDSFTRRRMRPGQDSSSYPVGGRSKNERLVKEEKSEVGKVKWKVYSDYLQAIGLIMFSATIIFTILRQSFSVGSNIWLSEWSSDKSIVVNGSQDIDKRNMYLGVYGLLGFAETVSTFFSSIFWFLGAADAGTLLHYLLLVNIMHCPMSFFETTPQGRIISRFAKDIDIIDNIIPSSGKQLLSHISAEIGTILVISYSTPVFLVAIVPIGFVYYFIQRYYVTTSQQLKRLESVSRSPIYSHFGESVSGSSTIRAYSAEERFIKESEEKVDYNQACTYPSIVANRWLAVRLQILGNLIVFFCALFSVIGKDSLSPGIVALSVTYALQITQSLTMLTNTSAEVETNIVAVERIKEYAELPREAAWEICPNLIQDDWPLEGKVEFIEYQLRYRDGLDLVLNGINLSIKGGEKYVFRLE